MTEIKTCGCELNAQITFVYRNQYCPYFHYSKVWLPKGEGTATLNSGWLLERHVERDRCALCGRRYTVSHAGELVHPQTGCPNVPIILETVEIPLFWETRSGLIPRSQKYWASIGDR